MFVVSAELQVSLVTVRSQSDLCGGGDRSKVGLVMTAQPSVQQGSASFRHTKGLIPLNLEQWGSKPDTCILGEKKHIHRETQQSEPHEEPLNREG